MTSSSLIKIGETVNIIKGLPLRIKCEARGIPVPDISWELNRKPIKDDSIIQTKDSVLILKFQDKHKGYYKCVATNVLGQARAFSDVRIIGKISSQIWLIIKRTLSYIVLIFTMTFKR